MSNDDRPLQDLDPEISPSQSAISHATTRLITDTTERCSIGHYRLLKKLGEGGMGQVWLADQMAPVRRQVALKLIRAGICDDTMLHRFQSEEQALAIMDHPSIAKVFDAGATADGQPYLVMQYVPGLPITDYCDQKKLSIRERLKLFIQVCGGVQHAHQKSIIHRDLKPANVLVVEVDGKPTPRIIDFGLAKPAFPNSFAKVTITTAGAALGTPAYMSPEQADPGVRDVDTRTDVYSLGVILYELLTGSLPLDPEGWENKPLDYVLRQVRESDTPRPSMQFRRRASTDQEGASEAADVRSSDCKQLSNTLRGDLDWITMRALEKDRNRRYGTPFELSTDVSRYLNNEPVLAGPATRGYRIRKYAIRHRIALSVAAGLLVLLSGFVFAQAVALRRLTRERDRATRITEFMTDMFKEPDPSEGGSKVTAQEILDKASISIEKGLVKDPEVQAEMMYVMAQTYLNLSLYTRAHAMAKPALEARARLLGPDDPKTLESKAQFGLVLAGEGKFEEARKTLREALESDRLVFGPESPQVLSIIHHLALEVNDGDYEQGEQDERKVLEIATRRLGPTSELAMDAMDGIGNLLALQGRYPEAEEQFRKLADVTSTVLGPDNPRSLSARVNVAEQVEGQGRLADAEALSAAVVADCQRALGPEAPDTEVAVWAYADILKDEGRFADSEKSFRQLLAAYSDKPGPDFPETFWIKYYLAEVIYEQGRLQEAEKMQRATIAAQTRVLGPEEHGTLASECDLAKTLLKEGHYTEAEAIARRAFEIWLQKPGSQSPWTIGAARLLATILARTHRYSEATKLFADFMGKIDSTDNKASLSSAWRAFASVAAAANRSDDSLGYLQEAINLGYEDITSLITDDDLESLRHNPKFEQLLAELRRRHAKG